MIPLRALPNTVLTPHIGYVVEQGYDVFYREIVEDIAAWRAGRPIRVISAG
jgi:phosphoglycerate dehydrogenase-like enzyme